MTRQVSFSKELFAIDAEIGTEIWVQSEDRFYKAVPSYLGIGIPGPSDQTTITWVPVPSIVTQERSDVLSKADALWDFGVAASCQMKGVSGNEPIVNNWTVGGLTKALATGPDGVANATALTESGTAERWAQLIQANTVNAGWCRIKFSYLPGAQCFPLKYAAWGHAQGATELFGLPTIDSLLYPDSDRSYTAYAYGSVAYYDGFKFTPRPNGNGWIDAQIDITLHTGGTFLARMGMLKSASAEPIAGVALTVGPYTYEQSRVFCVSPVSGNAEYSLSQATASACPVLAPDIWIGGGSCLVEGFGNSCALSGNFSGGTSCTMSAVVCVRQLRPATTARTVLELTGSSASIKLQVNTTGKWLLSRTDDSAATLTQEISAYVAPVPVCVTVTHTGTELSLYIDGVKAGSLACDSAATITGAKLFGGDSKSILRNAAAWTRALSASEIGDASTEMRKLAMLPSRWPVTIHSGQSNATAGRGNSQRLFANGVFGRPGVAMFPSDYGSENTSLVWQPGGLSDSGFEHFGLHLGYSQAATENGECCVSIVCASGGTPISVWTTPGSAMYSYLPNQIAAGLSALGTSLYEITDFTWVQGEAECNSAQSVADAYLANLRLLRSRIRSLYGSGVRFTLHRINTWLGTGTADYPTDSYPRAATVRAAQDTFYAEDPNTFMSRLDGGQWLGYNVHYGNGAIFELGRQLYLASRKKPSRVQIINPDYPQRGSWAASGAFWDAENGIAKTGSNVTTFTAREGGSVLTAAGTPTYSQAWSGGKKCIAFADATAYMTCIDGTKWAGFGGTNIAMILAIQFMIPTLVGSKDVLNFGNSDSTHRQARIVTTATPTTLGISAYSAGNTPTQIDQTTTIAENKVVNLVYCISAAKRYVLSMPSASLVLSAAATDFSGAVTAPDRLVLNGILTSGGGSLLVRRLGVKLTTIGNALGEAMALFTQLTGLD